MKSELIPYGNILVNKEWIKENLTNVYSKKIIKNLDNEEVYEIELYYNKKVYKENIEKCLRTFIFSIWLIDKDIKKTIEFNTIDDFRDMLIDSSIDKKIFCIKCCEEVDFLGDLCDDCVMKTWKKKMKNKKILVNYCS